MTKVKIIREENGKVLVEWFGEYGELQRSILPSSDVDPGGYCENPYSGLPYGMDFLPHITVEVTPEDIVRSLHNSGIWTAEELLSKPALVQGAINAAYGVVLSDLLANVMNLRQRS